MKSKRLLKLPNDKNMYNEMLRKEYEAIVANGEKILTIGKKELWVVNGRVYILPIGDDGKVILDRKD